MKFTPLSGDRVDRILTRKIGTDKRLLLNSRKTRESFKEIRQYSYNKKVESNAKDFDTSVQESIR
jgi:hypothetical protein